MNHRSSGPRSFNTVKRSNREERLKRRRQCDQTLASIAVVFFLLILSAFILLVCNVAVGIHNRNQATEGEGALPDAPNLPEVTYDDSTQDYRKGELVVVNGNHAYTFAENDADKLVELSVYRQLVDGKNPYQISTHKSQRLQEIAAEKLSQLLTAYYQQTGNVLWVYDTYRTADDQSRIEATSGVPAGKSEHHTGLVFSLSEVSSTIKMKLDDHEALFRMCHQYGFIQRYPSGKGDRTGVNNYEECLRYVGVAHATYIYNNGLCLEEYVEMLRKNHVSENGTDGKHLLIDTDNDGTANYAVYYVPKNETGNLATVKVPKGMPYTVSGDNIGGVIVTITLNS